MRSPGSSWLNASREMFMDSPVENKKIALGFPRRSLVQHDGDPGYAGCHHQLLRIFFIAWMLTFGRVLVHPRAWWV
jgi:hypothetical protein